MPVIESPCKNVCIVDRRSEICIGCGRTVAEVASWMRMSAAERRRIMSDLPQRIRGLADRRGTQNPSA
jgi:hypothetical protein